MLIFVTFSLFSFEKRGEVNEHANHRRRQPERRRRQNDHLRKPGGGLAQAGKKVLLVDADPQGSLTISLGHPQPDKLPFTLSDVMGRILMDEPLRPGEGILHHPEGVDLMPADIQLSGMEVSLVNAMSRETILRQYLDTAKGQYSHILIDCQPSLGMLTVNALAAANRVIIPVKAEYLPAKGLEQLLSTVNKVKRQINPKLQIDGILLTMVDNRTNFAKEIAALRTHIVNYAKTREVYVAYRKAGYSRKFRDEHESEILLHQAAKNAFDDLGVKKLPKVRDLQAEYARLLEEKKKTYAEYRSSREEIRELLAAKANVDRILNMEAEQDAEKEKDHGQR